MTLHVEITAHLVERATLTGHPRLLARLLRHEAPAPGTFEGVQIEAIRVWSAAQVKALWTPQDYS